MIVENAFGALKNKFSILRQSNHYEAGYMGGIFNCCVIIHNMLLEWQDDVELDFRQPPAELPTLPLHNDNQQGI